MIKMLRSLRKPVLSYFPACSFTSKGSADWMRRHLQDSFVKAAKRMNYRSRAAFKLIEMDKKLKLFDRRVRVLEIGSAPGSWTQVISEKVNAKAGTNRIIAVDILHMEPVKGALFIKGDIRDKNVQKQISDELKGGKVDLVISLVF